MLNSRQKHTLACRNTQKRQCREDHERAKAVLQCKVDRSLEINGDLTVLVREVVHVQAEKEELDITNPLGDSG